MHDWTAERDSWVSEFVDLRGATALALVTPLSVMTAPMDPISKSLLEGVTFNFSVAVRPKKRPRVEIEDVEVLPLAIDKWTIGEDAVIHLDLALDTTDGFISANGLRVTDIDKGPPVTIDVESVITYFYIGERVFSSEVACYSLDARDAVCFFPGGIELDGDCFLQVSLDKFYFSKDVMLALEFNYGSSLDNHRVYISPFGRYYESFHPGIEVLIEGLGGLRRQFVQVQNRVDSQTASVPARLFKPIA